jgi:hypothetical protein
LATYDQRLAEADAMAILAEIDAPSAFGNRLSTSRRYG